MKKSKQRKGFTLIELLMVIAIIGILAGILIPTVGSVRKQAKIAQSKTQLQNYVNAIQLFKAEYKFYPFVTGTTDVQYSLQTNSAEFIETLSGKTTDRTASSAGWNNANRRRQAFHSFAESEFLYDQDTDTYSDDELADAFDNVNIVIVIDGDGDQTVTPSPTDSSISVPAGGIRTPITAYVDTDPSDSRNPTYGLWE